MRIFKSPRGRVAEKVEHLENVIWEAFPRWDTSAGAARNEAFQQLYWLQRKALAACRAEAKARKK